MLKIRESEQLKPLERLFTYTNAQTKKVILRLPRLHCVSTKPKNPHSSEFLLFLPFIVLYLPIHITPILSSLVLGLNICDFHTLGLKV